MGKSYVIYKVTNKINGRIYIGKTNNFEKRKIEHTKYDIDNHLYFHKALKKYGEENFTWEIIDSADTLEEINALEKHYIETFNTYKPNGYNMTKGGDGGSMWNARPVVCLTLKGKFVKRYDSAGEAERIDGFCNSDVLLSCKNEFRTCKNHIFMFEDEYKKYGARKYEKPDHNLRRHKSVIQFDMEGYVLNIYGSVQEASDISGVRRSSISSCLRKKLNIAGNYQWLYLDEYNPQKEYKYEKHKKGIRVAQIDPKTNKTIAIYERIADAGRALKKNYKSIHKVVNMPDKTAYGYKWKTVI